MSKRKESPKARRAPNQKEANQESTRHKMTKREIKKEEKAKEKRAEAGAAQKGESVGPRRAGPDENGMARCGGVSFYLISPLAGIWARRGAAQGLGLAGPLGERGGMVAARPLGEKTPENPSAWMFCVTTAGGRVRRLAVGEKRLQRSGRAAPECGRGGPTQRPRGRGRRRWRRRRRERGEGRRGAARLPGGRDGRETRRGGGGSES